MDFSRMEIGPGEVGERAGGWEGEGVARQGGAMLRC